MVNYTRHDPFGYGIEVTFTHKYSTSTSAVQYLHFPPNSFSAEVGEDPGSYFLCLFLMETYEAYFKHTYRNM
jgi:hypothetical protein